jgi:hypothetical protein
MRIDLHLVTGELNQFRRTFLPMLAMVRSLREHANMENAQWQLSELARTYLNDVQVST